MYIMKGRFNILFCLLLINILKGTCDDETEVTFKYLTSYLKNVRTMSKDDIEKNSVNVLKPIIFIIGHRKGNEYDNWNRILADAYTNRYISNVFIVERSANTPAGPSAASTIADFIIEIYDRSGETYLDIHLVGVSLGCDVAALTAENLRDIAPSRKINRITCLDPLHYGKDIPLENVDFVDVVFSDVNDTESYIGDVVFYVDGECDSKDNCKIPNSVALFSKSINTDDITATKCDSIERFRLKECVNEKTVIFGEDANKNTRGKFYLEVRN